MQMSSVIAARQAGSGNYPCRCKFIDLLFTFSQSFYHTQPMEFAWWHFFLSHFFCVMRERNSTWPSIDKELLHVFHTLAVARDAIVRLRLAALQIVRRDFGNLVTRQELAMSR